MNVPTISPQKLAALRREGRVNDLLDVRTPVEYREVHVAGARNWPLDKLEPAAVMGSRHAPEGAPLYVICHSGSRGRQACEKFLAAGYANVVNVEGGTLACLECDLPVVRGANTVSLERQVRIAAGSLVVLGVALGWLAHPAFAGIAAFVGVGLVVAGVTDTCGMGLLLARMPWNRVQDGGAACADREVASPESGGTPR